MDNLKTINVPNIGDFDDVEIIEVLVHVGDLIGVDDSLITVESDKASMEIPSTLKGEVAEVLVSVGDRVSIDTPIIVVSAAEGADSAVPAEPDGQAPSVSSAIKGGASDDNYDVLVIGAGPGGYTAAFRAADLGLSVLIAERYPDLGGVSVRIVPVRSSREV